MPHALRHFLGLWAVGSVIGATLDVDLLCLPRIGIVRIQVVVLNLDAFKRSTIDSLSSDKVVQRKGYEFRYNLKKRTSVLMLISCLKYESTRMIQEATRDMTWVTQWGAMIQVKGPNPLRLLRSLQLPSPLAA